MSEQNDLPWLPLYVGDYLRATRTWPLGARALYLEMLVLQWERGDLPASVDELRALFPGVSSAEFSRHWLRIAGSFPVVDGVRRNESFAARREKQIVAREKRATRAKKAAGERWRERTGGHA